MVLPSLSLCCPRIHCSHHSVRVTYRVFAPRYDRQMRDLSDFESWSISFIGSGMPNGRLGIPSTTKTTVLTSTEYDASIQQRRRQLTDSGRRRPTRRPFMPGNSRWSALNLKQKRRKLERQGPSITAWIPCIMQQVPATEVLLVRTRLRCMHEQKERERRTTTPRWRRSSKSALATALH